MHTTMLLLMLGNTFKALKNYPNAIRCCEAHLEITRELKDRLGEGININVNIEIVLVIIVMPFIQLQDSFYLKDRPGEGFYKIINISIVLIFINDANRFIIYRIAF